MKGFPIKIKGLETNRPSKIDSSITPLLISFIPCFLCFLPLMMGYEFDYGGEDKNLFPITDAISSTEFACATVAGLAVCIPILLEFLFDASLTNKNDRQVFIPCNWIIALILPLILTMVLAIPTADAGHYICIVVTQRILFINTFLFHMHLYEPKVWTSRIFIFLVILSGMAEGMKSFSYFDFPSNFQKSTFFIALILEIVSSLIVVHISILWLKYYLRDSTPKDPNRINTETCIKIYLSAFIFYIITQWVMAIALAQMKGFKNLKSPYLCAISASTTIVTILATVTHMRLMRRDLMHAQVFTVFFIGIYFP